MSGPRPTVLQTGPETFRVHVGGAWVEATLAHRTRRGLGLQQVPPVEVVAEMLRILEERDAIPPGAIDLGPAVGAFPEFAEELRARLR